METRLDVIWLVWLMPWLFFGIYLFAKNHFKIRDELGGFPLKDLTVLIPFRNEALALPKLLDAIVKQSLLPAKFIFIDDHSTDNSTDIIQDKLQHANINFEILQMPKELNGKKQALMFAANHAKSKYLQTIDADVWFSENFFRKLPNPHDYKMLVLPVRMIGKNWLTKIMELEYGSFQILQASVKRKKPLMASGANLIVERQSYLENNDIYIHLHRQSGDDQYALNEFLKTQQTVTTYFDEELAVYTETPKSTNELLKQRTRWMGNNTQGNDFRATILAIFILFVNLVFMALFFTQLFNKEVNEAIITFASKLVVDVIIYFNWFKRNNTWSLLAYLPVLTLLYPLYLITLLGSYASNRKQTWKNRPIQT
jgi:glycosyltransferase involved in cell wall biosynthesis